MRYKPKTRPRRYQAEALKRAFQCGGRYGLFLAPRTGKTKVAIDFMGALFLTGKARIAIVVCQLTGHPVWKQQLDEHCAVPYRLIPLLGSSTERVARLQSLEPDDTLLTVILLNYESTWRIEEGIASFVRDLNGRWMLICDEGHKLKNRTSKQSRCCHRLVQVFDPYRLLLTGTHIANSPLDVFSEYMVIDDSVFGRRWAPFTSRYATFSGFYNSKVKYRNLADLRRRARTRATVLTKDECLDLPGREDIIVDVELTEKTRKAYQDMADYYVMQTEEGDTASAAIVLTQLMRLSQITGGFVKLDDDKGHAQIGTEKLDALADLLEEQIDAGDKVVVFCWFRWEIEAVEKLCQKRRWKSYRYYGEKNAKMKAEMLEFPRQFQQHDGPAVFIAQTATGALSIDLSAASTAIFYSFDYSHVNWQQCHDRIEGHLSKRKISYLYLVARKTNDRKILATLRAKKKMSSLLDNHATLIDILRDDEV